MKNSCTHHQQEDKTTARVAASATVHCLTGCFIGEFIGLVIGVSLGFSVLWIIVLDTTLAFITGFALSLIPLMRHKKMSLKSAFKILWLGEVISISVMEFAMNLTDYLSGGMTVDSIWNSTFWVGVILAAIAGYIAAYPFNYWMIKKNMKKCH
ncbi:DUF4396 domain-containing protein [Candidatus Peregrinibacteria bacterium]|jgi:hypothetical protein|nr:DUF4396 domain-containing protein [Candidatus Peregrinibacteria bacterium]